MSLRSVGGNWVVGDVGSYQVQAKVFTEASHYGMPQEPRISVLHVTLMGTVVYDYDRNDLPTDHIYPPDLAEIISVVAGRS